ncbi:cysteine peptidase family C39 domain-containing protein [Sulfitobacter sp. D35]|uniref:cysteine peptidase family C39 domain-containing protein n=1 Tax=Sulfitobacter sp. D35 TaxID=3083252 RepID=UPI00296EEC3F|nr:cysteine peptidase family C39 domain-containing protein [Sulfitobacter sp. D35]MDW4499225.1 cysteine peptidase family C39 domain-containing protein [Sulfitobacter sp. D35]
MKSVERLQFGWGRKLPVILQSEASECGLACLAMIASHHGRITGPGELRRRFGFTSRKLLGLCKTT